MFLKRIRLFNFRCYEEIELNFDPHFNTITGMNGQGKTSILEGIYLLAALKSFRLAKNPELIRSGHEDAAVNGEILNGDISTILNVKINSRTKHSTVNGKSCKLLSEYIGKLAAVTFSPSDLEIIRGTPEFRRHWIDRVATVYDPQHIDYSSRYTKVLNHRNKELRRLALGQAQRLPEDFDSWTEELVRLGAEVIHRRLQAVDKIAAPVNGYYNRISRSDDNIQIQYKSGAVEGFDAGQEIDFSLDSISQFLNDSLKKLAARERIVGSTLVGPHRDDLKMMFNGNLLKAFGSQGEVRSTILAMRLAEVQAHRDINKLEPLLLIDDFSSELDSQRRSFLLDYLTSLGSQVFLSTTETLKLGKVFNVNEGKVTVNGN